MTPFLSPNRDLPALDLASEDGLDRVLATIDSMASQRPVAARIVTATNSDDVSARELSRVLATDVALAGRVMKLANSATFGMRGRVDSLQFAVTVVGFTTVRTMATVALTDLDDESRLPDDFWATTTCLALAAASVAPRFGLRAQDALCVGLLAELGTALLYLNDPDGYADTVERPPDPRVATRRGTSALRHGRRRALRGRAGPVELSPGGGPADGTDRGGRRSRGRRAAGRVRSGLPADGRGLRAAVDGAAQLRPTGRAGYRAGAGARAPGGRRAAAGDHR